MRALVTFLGKAQRLNDRGTANYRQATYRFDDGAEFTSRYIGLALTQRLKPDRLVLFGTASSMWDVLVEDLLATGEATAAAEDLRLELMAATEKGEVDQPLLDRVAGLVRPFFGTKELWLRLIPHGRNVGEQQGILDAIAHAADRADRVDVDVTHGFRHLSMLGFLSAFMIERLQKVKVDALWYGAMDMARDNGGVAPVLRLDGLLAIQRWVEALDRFDASGDYGVFEPLLVADGVPADKARCLRDAAYLEKTLNLPAARQKLLTFRPELDAPLLGASGLFRKRLAQRLDWIERDSLAEQQRLLAQRALHRNDYLRAAIFGVEAMISGQFDPKDPAQRDYAAREAADKVFQQSLREGDHPDWKRSAYWLLKNLRNAMAHGLTPAEESYTFVDGKKRPIAQLLKNEDALRTEMQRCLSRLGST